MSAERLLFVHAADDGTAPVANVAAYVRARPAVGFVQLPRGGHHPYLRQPGQTFEAIAAFVERVTQLAR